MKRYFTSDWHLGDDRIGINGKPNLFYRPFDSVHNQNHAIFNGLVMSPFKNGDTLYHLGDVLYNLEDDSISWLQVIRDLYPNSKFHLIIGNYDDNKLDILGKYFDTMQKDDDIQIDGQQFYLNHYPSQCLDSSFALTGHIHGLWKVQKNMVNVGVDAWHFKPVSEDEIKFCRNAVEKYYDINVFPY